MFLALSVMASMGVFVVEIESLLVEFMKEPEEDVAEDDEPFEEFLVVFWSFLLFIKVASSGFLFISF